MDWFVITITAIGLAVVAFFVRSTSRRLAAQRDDFTRLSGAYIDPVFYPEFDRATRLRFRTVGTFGALHMVAASLLFTQTSDLNVYLCAVPVDGALIAVWASLRMLAAGHEFGVPGRASAVARARRVVLSDYVPPIAQALTWCAALCSVAIAIGVGVLWRSGDANTLPAVVTGVDAAVTVGMAALAWSFGRVMCARPTPAVDACHLYLQDAWRARAVAYAHLAVCIGAVLLPYGLSFSPGLSAAFGYHLSWLGLPLVAMWIIVLHTSRKQFRRRLWSTLKPSEMLYPGQPVPPRVGAGA